jgi:hypothetical protein
VQTGTPNDRSRAALSSGRNATLAKMTPLQQSPQAEQSWSSIVAPDLVDFFNPPGD